MSDTPNQQHPECYHYWKFVDASFDHEFGTEQVFYEECENCGKTQTVHNLGDANEW